jgi:hypothetical protein
MITFFFLQASMMTRGFCVIITSAFHNLLSVMFIQDFDVVGGVEIELVFRIIV